MTVYKKAPKIIQNFISPAQDGPHSLRSQSLRPLDLRIPNYKTRAGVSGFSAQGPAGWNKIPNELRAIDQKSRFKVLLKDSILKTYENKILCHNPRCRDRNNHNCFIDSVNDS